MHLTQRRSLGGFSLIELMVGMTVGLFVILASTTVYINSLRGSNDSMRANRLNQDLRAAMDILVADVRRAGHWGSAASGTANPFTSRTGNATDLFLSVGCILYSYDATFLPGGAIGIADAGVDFFGFRLNDRALQMLSDAALDNTSTDCGNASWSNLTDPAEMRINALSFDTVGSQCIAFDTETFNPVGFVAPSFPGSNAEAAWWAVTAGSAAACDEVPGGVAVPATANARLEIRQINITLTGQHAQDATLTRTLTESVVVRNNRVLGP